MLSEALRLLRVFHDMKQKDLANKLGISKSYISEIENGNRIPSFEVIGKYATQFKVPVSSIIFFSEQIETVRKNNGQVSNVQRAIASKIINFLRLLEERTETDGVR